MDTDETESLWPVSELKAPFKRHVFITHCEADYDEAKNLYHGLKRMNFICGLAKADFKPGTPIFDQIIQAIEESQKVLTIISEDALKSFWFVLELHLSLERSIRNECLALVPVLRNVRKEQLPDVLRQYEGIETSEGYLPDVAQMLIGPDVPVKALLPVGNVGHGLAWSYYYSFLAFVLPGLSERIEKSEYWKNDPAERNMPRKIYLLLPESCSCPQKLTQLDDRILSKAQLGPIHRMRAGKARKYHNSVYNIIDDKPYYFVAECCSVVAPLRAMEKGGIANLTADEKQRQVYRFMCTLKSILTHSHPDTFEILLYKDDEPSESIYKRLLSSVKEDIKADIELDKLKEPARPMLGHGVVAMDTEESCVAAMEIEYGGISDTWKFDVFILYSDGVGDRAFAIDLTNFLENTHGMKCAVKDRDLFGNKPLLDQIYELKKRSKRTVLILSDETSDNVIAIFRMILPPDRDDLSEAVQPIPLLRCREITENKTVSDLCKTLTYVETESRNFKPGNWSQRLLTALRAKVVKPGLPAGNVAEGFAWSLFYGYFLRILPDLHTRLGESLWYTDISHTLSHSMYFFMPENGRMLDRLDDLPGLESAQTVERKADNAGNVGRSYDSALYRIYDKETDQHYYFVGEYVTPLAVIQDMEVGQEAGMTSDARTSQVTLLYDRLEQIMAHEDARHLQGLWRFFRYDNSPENRDNVWCEILRMIKEDTACG